MDDPPYLVIDRTRILLAFVGKLVLEHVNNKAMVRVQ